LADGSCVEVKGSVVVHVEVPGYEGNSLGFEEECLVIEMVQSQHQLLLGKKTVIEQSLLEWTQEENTPIESKLEKSLNTDFVSFEADLDAEWTCGIPRLKPQITEIIQDYKAKVDPMTPAKVEKFTLEVEEESTPPASKLRRI
ncbi:hypothetical protein ADUPG1_002042, partial [Aduncisulcus paluster]